MLPNKIINIKFKKLSKKYIFILVFLILAIGYLVELKLFNIHSSDEKLVYFKIEKGQKSIEILGKLADNNLISSKYFSYIYVKVRNIKIQPGVYYLYTNQSAKENILKISKGEIAEKKLTFIEGWRIEQYAQLLDKEGIVLYQDFLDVSKPDEGKLYPDTYQIAIKTTPQKIVEKMIDNYNQKMIKNKISPSQEDITIASIVEREAKFDEDRAVIAGVFKNRLKLGMALEADPTVQYAKENSQGKDYKYWQELEVGDIALISPYNTYQNKGLPPGPICNPSLKSILAVINFDKNDYLYFVHDREGKAHFGKNITEHNNNKQKYLN